MARLPTGSSQYRCNQFTGEFEWASNFHQSPLTLNGIEYPSAEHAFQAAKTLDPHAHQQIAHSPTPGAAKRLGRQVTLRPQWDQRVRFEQMFNVLQAKFQDPTLRQLLASSADKLLVEGNHHCDQVWGCCYCARHAAWPGDNELGRTLMRLRAQLLDDHRLLRVACTGHRAQQFSAAQWDWVQHELERVAVKLKQQYGTLVAIHGGATGADLAWAEAVITAGVDELWAYLPFEDQAAQFPDRYKKQWEHYTRLHSEGGVATLRWCLGTGYDVRLFHARNEAMIRDADAFVAVIDPGKTSGGTITTLQKISQGRRDGCHIPVITLNVIDKRTTWTQ